MAERTLNKRSMDKPTIRNGRRISQIRGNRINTTKARGQQSMNRMHQRIRLISVFILDFSDNALAISLPDTKTIEF